MREILFRGKRVDNGEWIEGGVLHDSLFGKWYMKNDNIDGGLYEVEGCETDEYLQFKAYEVDPSTVCQYTDLTDRMGKKIFEHDIVRTEIANFEVYFDKDLLGYALYDGGRKTTLATTFSLEIIGNIFDNPELIGE